MNRISIWRSLIAAVAIAGTAAGCSGALDVENPNAPDAERAFSDPATVSNVVGGTIRQWTITRQDPNAGLLLNSMADHQTASWNNWNLRYYTSYGAECGQRCGWVNDVSSSFYCWKLNVLTLYPDNRWDEFTRNRIRTLPSDDPNLCCVIHKVQPMQRAMKDMKAWISGIRRDQTPVRARAKILELQEDGLLKINPLLNWTKEDIKNYLREHGLPVHPLFQRGYRSIGCSPCTVAIGLNDDERAGRWHGRGKIECGLHTSMFSHKDPAEIRLDFKLDISAGEK